ncbi:hypothetical protein BDZ89DRAFT_1059576 [Hymenopellis radicata]|nr:hypothetical protein BDZ89DRAFT_1059576 [Hymenopellis radicata]
MVLQLDLLARWHRGRIVAPRCVFTRSLFACWPSLLNLLFSILRRYTYIIYLVLFVVNCYGLHWSYTNWYVQALLNAVTALAPTMIISRVMSGEARPNDSWTRPSLPHMCSTMRDMTESIRCSSFCPARSVTTLDAASSVGQVEEGEWNSDKGIRGCVGRSVADIGVGQRGGAAAAR